MAAPEPGRPEFGRARHLGRTLVLAVVFVLYLALGGVAFRYMETYKTTETVRTPGARWQPLITYLLGNVTEKSSTKWLALKTNIISPCDPRNREQIGILLESFRISSESDSDADNGQHMDLSTSPVTSAGHVSLDEVISLCNDNSYQLSFEEREVPWSFIDSVFFCMTVVTTIGYGYNSPKTPCGQIFCIVYSLFGIPASGLLLAGLSDFFAGNLFNFYDSKWRQRHGDSRWSLAAFTVLYLMVGFLVFIFVPAILFTWLEGWNYREAVYYAFITLSTIGFGDYTAAVSEDSPAATVYKLLVLLWIFVGLGYWVLVLNFLQKALNSKEVLKALKSTSRLIAREADELRAVLAEHGVIHRQAEFIPEHSKVAISLMLTMSSSLAGTSSMATAGDTAGITAGLRGIHSIGDNLRSPELLRTLLASLPPQPSAAQQGGLANEAFLPDDSPKHTGPPPADTPATETRQQQSSGN